jgi:hypothetical protein
MCVMEVECGHVAHVSANVALFFLLFFCILFLFSFYNIFLHSIYFIFVSSFSFFFYCICVIPKHLACFNYKNNLFIVMYLLYLCWLHYIPKYFVCLTIQIIYAFMLVTSHTKTTLCVLHHITKTFSFT